MAWENIKQRSLGDGLIVEHKAFAELDDVHALINWLPTLPDPQLEKQLARDLLFRRFVELDTLEANTGS